MREPGSIHLHLMPGGLHIGMDPLQVQAQFPYPIKIELLLRLHDDGQVEFLFSQQQFFPADIPEIELDRVIKDFTLVDFRDNFELIVALIEIIHICFCHRYALSLDLLLMEEVLRTRVLPPASGASKALSNKRRFCNNSR